MRTKSVFGIIIVVFLLILILMLINAQGLSNLVKEQWIDILYALIFAVIAGLLIEFVLDKIKKYRSKLYNETVPAPQKKSWPN
jgi:amino acid transporter